MYQRTFSVKLHPVGVITISLRQAKQRVARSCHSCLPPPLLQLLLQLLYLPPGPDELPGRVTDAHLAHGVRAAVLVSDSFVQQLLLLGQLQQQLAVIVWLLPLLVFVAAAVAVGVVGVAPVFGVLPVAVAAAAAADAALVVG